MKARSFFQMAAKLSTELHKADAAKLKSLLAEEGLTPNAFLTKCCMDYIKKHETEEQ